jgi:hypothetical protein
MRAMFDKYEPYYCAADTSLTSVLVKSKGHFIATASEIVLSLCDPNISVQDYEVMVTNASSGYISVITSQDMVDQSDGVALPPGESIEFTCERVGTSSPWRHAWSTQGINGPPKWASWAPDLTFTTATPALTTSVYRYMVEEGLLHFELDIATTDGAGATALTIPLPFIPQDLDVMVPVTANVTIGAGTPTNILGYVDVTHATAETRALVGFRNFQTLTDDSAARIRVSGVLPLWGCNTFTSTPAWTGSPTVTSTTGIYKVVNDTLYGWVYNILSDGKGATTATFTLPAQINDVDQLIACEGIELVDATYSNPKPYIEAANSSSASRLLSFASLSALTNGKACTLAIAFKYNLANDFVFAATETWGTADPASYTSVFRYAVHGRKCVWAYYGTSADGNAASSLTVPLPVVPRYVASLRKSIPSIQLVDSTYSCPAAYIDHSQATVAGRALLRFENLSACTDAKTATIMAAGEFEIAA